MREIGDRAKCPKCLDDARVVWISKDGKTIGIRCMNYHSHLTPPPTKWKSYNNQKTKRRVVFLVERSEVA